MSIQPIQRPEEVLTPTQQEFEAYYRKVGSVLALRVAAAVQVLGLTSNTDVTGSLAEGAVNQLIKDIVSPARVSSGTVLSPLQRNGKTLQVDTIIWTPMPLPALYEFGDTAIVPYESVLAIMEVKRSDYKGAADAISTRAKRAPELMRGSNKFLGVVCMVEGNPSPLLAHMVRERKCVWFLQRTNKGSLEANPHGVLTLVQFLVKVRQDMFNSGANQGLNPFALEALQPTSKAENESTGRTGTPLPGSNDALPPR